MASDQPAEEVERAHLDAFGPWLGPVYHAVHNEVGWLHAKWLEYRKLCARSEKRIDLGPERFRGRIWACPEGDRAA
jgi:hypothetical protein